MHRVARFVLLTLAFAASSSAQSYNISTFAGGAPPPANVSALQASIGAPHGIAVDRAGNIFFASDNCIFKLDSSGAVTLIAGNARPGALGDGGPALDAELNDPSGIAFDAAGNLYIADEVNNRIRAISPDGVISTFAPALQLNEPLGVLFDLAGNLYIADSGNNVVRRISPSGAATLVAGNGASGYSGDGGPAYSAQLNFPVGLTLDSSGNLFIADSQNNRIRKVTPGGTITTVAGNGTQGYSGDGGAATGAALANPTSVIVDSSGNLMIADSYNGAIREVLPSGKIMTVAGGPGSSSSASLGAPDGLAFDSAGNLLISDAGLNHIAKLSPPASLTVIAGNGAFNYSGDGGPATSARLGSAVGVAIGPGGDVYIADTANAIVRKVSPSGVITPFAGTGTRGFSGDNGPATSAQLIGPYGLAVDRSGNLYISDTSNNRIRKVSTNGTITTIAGNGTPGYSGDNGPASAAQLNQPRGIATDSSGNLYIADFGNHSVRKISSSGIITTVAGTGTQGFSGDGIPATIAELAFPTGVAIDSAGNLYITDVGNFRLYKVSTAGILTTALHPSMATPSAVAVDPAGNLYVIVGNGVLQMSPGGSEVVIAGAEAGQPGYSGDGGPATAAELSMPASIAEDPASGDIYIADNGNGAIRLLTPLPASCPYSISSTYIQSPAIGGNVTLNVTTTPGCAWSTLNLPSWITVSGPNSGSGSGTITLAVSPNSGPSRSAQVSVAGILITVSQPPVSSLLTLNAAVNAANFSPSVAPGSLASAFGAFPFANPAGASSFPIPTVLAGLSLQFTGAPPSPLFYANGTQVNLQVPWELAGLTQAALTPAVNGQTGQSLAVNLVAYAPAIFSVNSSGTGQGAILDQNYHLVDSTHPAIPGVTVLQIFCTGLGSVTNQPATGAPSPSNPPATTTTVPTVTIGATPAHVEFSGLAPGFVGLYQVNALVPSGAPSGNSVPVSLSIGGVTSNAVTIAVQ